MGRKVVFVYSYEFGYELLGFQGILRKHKSFFDTMVVCSFPASEIFYRDFADQFIPLPKDLLDSFAPAESPDEFDMNALRAHLRDHWSIDESYELYATHRVVYPYYPLAEALDLNGTLGDYIDFNMDSSVEKKPLISIFPRNHTVHPHRNYDQPKLKSLIRQVRDGFPEYNVRIVYFDTDYYSSGRLSYPKDGGIELVRNPSIQQQVDIHAESAFIIYNHSGAAFLPLFNKERTPLFVFAINSDWHRLYRPTGYSIFENRLPFSRFIASPTDDVSSLSPETICEEFRQLVNAASGVGA